MITTALPKTLDRLVQLLATHKPLKPAKARKLVLKAQVEVEDLMEYADFDHPVEDCYGRKLVYDGGFFEVMVMSWNPGHYSSIHNHGYTEWGVVQAFGTAQNNIFCIKDGQLHLAKKEILHAGDAIKVNHALIHQMGNPTTSRFVSLHVYGCNTRDQAVTADAKNFELEKNRISHTTGGAFFNLPEGQVYNFQPGIPPTAETFLHYAYRLMDYYNRQEDTPEIRELKRKLLRQMEACVC
ncbi:MAG: cysteine dioxygenase [Bacteroidetes bacterium]|nr:MAG: cysteine dioxygenase [Bacteroidota bacterium]